MSGEVAGKTLGLHVMAAQRAGQDPRDLFRDTTIDPYAIPEWVDWNDFAIITRRLDKLCGGPDEIALLGESLINVETLRAPVTVLRLGVTPRALYWGNVKWGGPALFKNLQDTSLEVIGEDTFRAIINVPEEYEGCREFFFLNQGLFRTVPQLIGLGRSIVEVEASDHRGVFTIIAPPSMDIISRVVRAFRAFRAVLALGQGLDTPEQLTFSYLVTQQDHLRRTNKELEEARALAEEQRRIAESALAVKSQFLATMSHELRTPLNGIMGVAELLAMTDLTASQHEYIHTIRDSGESLLAIINDILDYSKMEAGYLDAEQVEIPIRSLVSDVLDLFAGRAHHQGLELIGRVESGVPTRLRGNHRAIRQILQNLVSNAVKFTDAGEVEVEVLQSPLPATEPEKVRLQINVHDTGQGIAQEDFDRLFRPFAQLDASDTRRHGGTGLGLAICRQLADGLGGQITFQSTLGRGSTFSLDVQLVPIPAAEPPPAEPVGKRLLVLDDSPRVRRALIGELTSMGVEVDAATTPAEALGLIATAAALRRPYAAVLIDSDLPSEPSTLQELLLRDQRYGKLHVVMMTRTTQAPQADATSVGKVELLRKPIRAERLVSLLRNLGNPSREPALSAAPTVLWHAPRHSDGTSARVLVVEDHELNQRVARGMLAAMDIETEMAKDGAEALERLNSMTFDAVLMDCQMPRMDGLEATRRWRKAEHGGRHLPIIAMTAYASSADRDRCLTSGMDDYITKPVTLERLAAVLARWIEKTSWAEPARQVEPAAASSQSDTKGITERFGELRSLMAASDLNDLIVIFQEEAERDLGDIDHALHGRDAVQVELAAHRLKGSCSNMGANEAAARCGDLVDRARIGNLEQTDGLYPVLRQRVREACEILDGLRA